MATLVVKGVILKNVSYNVRIPVRTEKEMERYFLISLLQRGFLVIVLLPSYRVFFQLFFSFPHTECFFLVIFLSPAYRVFFQIFSFFPHTECFFLVIVIFPSYRGFSSYSDISLIQSVFLVIVLFPLYRVFFIVFLIFPSYRVFF